MADLKYSLGQEFYKIDALTTQCANFNTPSDPLSLNIKTSPSTDLNSVIENITLPSPQIVRLQTGVYLFNLNPTLYDNNTTYEVRFRYFATVSNLSVKRQTFTFAQLPEPSAPGRAIVYGTLKNARGMPVNNGVIVAETYKDFITLNSKLTSNEVRSNGFGHWWVELDVDSVARFVLGDYSKTVKVVEGVKKLSEVPEWVGGVDSVRVDKYGYPY